MPCFNGPGSQHTGICTSSDPKVTFATYGTNDAGCVAQTTVYWGDGSAASVGPDYPGGATGALLYSVSHTYAHAGQYSVTAITVGVSGCSGSVQYDLSFTLDHTVAVKLAPAYLAYYDNLTYATAADGTLTSMWVSPSGHVSGYLTVDPPLAGSGPLSGTLTGNTISFAHGAGGFTGTRNSATLQMSGTYGDSSENGVWKATPASPCAVSGTCPAVPCTAPDQKPASWDTARVASPVPGLSGYVEPLNVIVSACSTVPLSDIQAALGDWSTVSDTTSISFHGFHVPCISPEKADVAAHGYETQAAAWRLQGCLAGNVLSLTGAENHVRIWNQPSREGDSFGAWFLTASYETACVSSKGKLYTLSSVLKHLSSSMKLYHCIDGGPGSKGTDGYNRGAKDFANAVAASARAWGWNATVQTITRPVPSGQNVGEDGVKFNSTVYVLTVTLP